ncbi:TIC 20-I, chloroplastic-like protein, partial [Drosera capensis]
MRRGICAVNAYALQSFPLSRPHSPAHHRIPRTKLSLSVSVAGVSTNDQEPEWYWRFLAALPYLMPIHETWQHAETAYHLVPFLKRFELLTMPFYRALSRFPVWIFFVYSICAYIFVVRKTMLPHFMRFHVMMGMLVSITTHIFGEMWKSLPISLYWGKAGAHFWTAVAFGHLLTCLACLGCTLNGKYADVPGLADCHGVRFSQPVRHSNYSHPLFELNRIRSPSMA